MGYKMTANQVHRKKIYPINSSLHSVATANIVPVGARRRSRVDVAEWSNEQTGAITKFPIIKKEKNNNEKPLPIRELTEVEDISLRKLIRRAMQNVESRHMKSLPANLKATDKARLGLLPPNKIRENLQKNQISLGEASFRNLCRKFGEIVNDVHVVRYEKLVPFLSKLWAEAADLPKKKPSTPPVGGFSNNSDRVGGKSYIPSYTQGDLQSRRRYGALDEATFLNNLQMALFASGGNLANIGSVMREFDREGTNCLNEGQVYASFQQCGTYLPTDVFQQLLQATEVSINGLCDIGAIIYYLITARPDLANDLAYDAAYYPPQIDVVNSSSFDPNLSPFDEDQLEPQEPPNLSGQLLKEEPVPEVSELEEANKRRKWNEDLKCLLEALHTADEENLGFLPEPDVRNLSATYSQVYNLGLSEATINSALRKSLDANYNEINIDQFTGMLQKLHV